MSTSYHTFVKAPEVTSTHNFFLALAKLGARDYVAVEHGAFPDRADFVIGGLRFDLFNERLSQDRAIEPDELGYGYDFDLSLWVEFEDDTLATRTLVLRVAGAIAKHFPVSVTYNGGVPVARSEPDGNLGVADPQPGLVIDAIAGHIDLLDGAFSKC